MFKVFRLGSVSLLMLGVTAACSASAPNPEGIDFRKLTAPVVQTIEKYSTDGKLFQKRINQIFPSQDVIFSSIELSGTMTPIQGIKTYLIIYPQGMYSAFPYGTGKLMVPENQIPASADQTLAEIDNSLFIQNTVRPVAEAMKKLDIKSLAANNPNGLATFFDAARAVNPARLIESGTFDVSYSGVNIKGSVDRTGFIKELVKSGRFAQEIDRNEIVNSLSAPEICYAKKVTSKAGSIWFVPQIVAKDPTIGPGYGMNINSRKNEVFVTALVKDSPAERAGIACGDEIETVNGLDISKLDMAAIADVFKRSSAVVLECKTVDGQPKTFHLIKPTK